MSKENVETGRRNDYKAKYNDHYNLVLYSKEKSLSDIIEWVNQVIKEYKRYMKLKTIDSQLLLSISYQDELNVDSCNIFNSLAGYLNATFFNSNDF